MNAKYLRAPAVHELAAAAVLGLLLLGAGAARSAPFAYITN